jgi:nucleotide-binding universal stress UspA family protein
MATEIGEPGARKRVALIRAAAQCPKDGLTTLLREEDADLLVIGADAGGQLAYPFGGIRSGSLLRSCPCPLMVVPTGAINPFAARGLVAPGPIICGIDWSTSADGARVLSDAIGGALGVPVLPIYVDQIGPWPEAPRGIEVEVGEPAKALARAASVHRAPLIVVGVGGRETLIPSVGLGLAATSPVPILIVPPGCRLPRFRTAADMELVRAADLVQAA